MQNLWFYTQNTFKAEEFLKATGNTFKVVNVAEYTDKKGKLGEGLKLRLLILKDEAEYGLDKDGNERQNNVDENFDVYVLSREVVPVKGDYVALEDFNSANSFVIGFDAVLRFNSCKIVKKAR